MRLFVAVTVPADVRREVVAALGDLCDDDRLAWTRPDGWHATLAFLGDLADDVGADAVAAAVATGVDAAATGPVAVTVGAPTTLARRSALALTLEDEPDGALGRLGDAVQEAVAAAGIPVLRRAVRPHLTLARARRRRSVPAEVQEAVDVPPLRWTVTSLAVVESVRGAGPARYPTRATVPLVR